MEAKDRMMISRARRGMMNLLKEITQGSGVVIGENQAQAGRATIAQRKEVILNILSTGFAMNVQIKFCIGDLWNSLPSKYGKRRELLFDNLPADRAEKIFKQLRQFGWVAGKWPPRERLKDLPWQFYVDNLPNQPEDFKPRLTHKEKQEALQREAFEAGQIMVRGGEFRFNSFEEWKASTDQKTNCVVGIDMAKEGKDFTSILEVRLNEDGSITYTKV